MGLAQPACPICKAKNHQLFPVDSHLKSNLKKIGIKKIPPTICSSCYKNISKKISGNIANTSSTLTAQERNRALIWKNRTLILKKAQKLFDQKVYSRAADNFEKYLRIVEAANKKKKGELTPDVFSKSRRSRELTVVTSVYWSLLKIYDMNDKHEAQMMEAAKKFSEFLPYSYIYNEIIRKYKSLIKSAKHQKVFRDCFKSAKKSHKKCFIASSAFDSEIAPEVIDLRNFKKNQLELTQWGRTFIQFYYWFSPKVANYLDKNSYLKPIVRKTLKILIYLLKKLNRT